MSRHISKTIYDYCLKLYTLLCYINLKICILFGDDSFLYFRVIEFFVKKRGFFSHVALYLYCLKLNRLMLRRVSKYILYNLPIERE